MTNTNKVGILIIFLLMLIVPTQVNAAITDYDIIKISADTFNYQPTPTVAGKDFDIWIQVTNNSNKVAENIEYFLDTKYPFSIVSNNNTGKIATLAPYQSKIIKYTLNSKPNTLDGTYKLDFKFKRQEIDIYSVQTYNIDVKGDPALIDVINSNIDKASIGSNSNVNFTFKNLGGKNAKDIFVSLSDSQDEMVQILNLKTQYIPKLNVGDEQQINFTITISKAANNKSYTLPITITYSDDDGTYTTTKNLGVEIIDNPEIVINVLSIGTDNTIKTQTEENLSLEIYNIGNIDAESVYVEIEDNSISDNFSKYFVGSIEKDNYDSVDFKFTTNKIETGSYPLTINVHYKDRNLKEQKISKTIEVNVIQGTDSNSGKKIILSILSILGIIVGLALLIVILRWLLKILIKPAINIISELFRKKKK